MPKKKKQRKQAVGKEFFDPQLLSIFGLSVASEIQSEIKDIAFKPEDWTCGVIFQNVRTGDEIRTWGK